MLVLTVDRLYYQYKGKKENAHLCLQGHAACVFKKMGRCVYK